MGELDGIGDAVTGGLLARAVEPGAGEAGDTDGDGRTDETICLNCGTPLAGPYCRNCGQKAHVHRSLRAFGADFVAGLFNFEGKFWRTLPMLAWRPGELTRRYIEGERARFISPVALYLFSVFLMFAVLSFNNTFEGVGTGGIEVAMEDEQAQLKRLEGLRAAQAARRQDTAAIDRQIASAKDDIADLERLQRGEIIQTEGMDDPDTPAWLRDMAANAQKDPKGTALAIQDAASKFSWLLIPISVPFLWLLFPFYRRYRLYDHTVFITYSVSFMMMLVIAGGLLVAAGYTSLASMLALVPPIHMYRQLKGAYRLGWFSALLRTVALVTFAFIAGTLWFVATVAIGTM